jgi:hypothetical protein
MNDKPDRVTYRWDDQIGGTPGWYCQRLDDSGNVLDDSQKIWWPVDVDYYDEGAEPDLVAALCGAFPDAIVEPA